MQIPERSAEDRAAGILRVTVGNAGTKRLPTLPMRAAAEWSDSLGPALQAMIEKLGTDAGEIKGGDLTAIGRAAQEAILEAVVAYDRGSALGGREWLEEHADPEQLYIAFRQIVLVVFPFVGDAMGILRLLPELLRAGTSGSPSSTSGPSSTGGSTPEPS